MHKISQGDVVFTKKVWKFGGNDTQLEFATKKGAYYINLVLGLLTDRKELPTNADIHLLAGQIGMIGTDDIAEALGQEAVDKVIAHVTNKYAPPKVPVGEPTEPVAQ